MNRFVRIVAEAILRQRDPDTWTAYPSDEEYAAAEHVLGKQREREMVNFVTAGVYRAVENRAGGVCEAWHHTAPANTWRRCRRVAHVMDHWLGGSGRRKTMESVETCWMLCARCNDDRTDNRPSAAYWNESNRLHVLQYGYTHTPHLTHQTVPAK